MRDGGRFGLFLEAVKKLDRTGGFETVKKVGSGIVQELESSIHLSTLVGKVSEVWTCWQLIDVHKRLGLT